MNQVSRKHSPGRDILAVQHLHQQRYGSGAHKFHAVINRGDFRGAAGGKKRVVIAGHLKFCGNLFSLR